MKKERVRTCNVFFAMVRHHSMTILDQIVIMDVRVSGVLLHPSPLPQAAEQTVAGKEQAWHHRGQGPAGASRWGGGSRPSSTPRASSTPTKCQWDHSKCQLHQGCLGQVLEGFQAEQASYGSRRVVVPLETTFFCTLLPWWLTGWQPGRSKWSSTPPPHSPDLTPVNFFLLPSFKRELTELTLSQEIFKKECGRGEKTINKDTCNYSYFFNEVFQVSRKHTLYIYEFETLFMLGMRTRKTCFMNQIEDKTSLGTVSLAAVLVTRSEVYKICCLRCRAHLIQKITCVRKIRQHGWKIGVSDLSPFIYKLHLFDIFISESTKKYFF